MDIHLGFVSLFILTSTAISINPFNVFLLLFVPLYFLIFLYFDKLFNSTNDDNERKDFLFILFGFTITQTTIFVNYLI